jgi:hypothetical protein
VVVGFYRVCVIDGILPPPHHHALRPRPQEPRPPPQQHSPKLSHSISHEAMITWTPAAMAA